MASNIVAKAPWQPVIPQPPEEVLTPAQWKMLLAIMDTVVPPVRRQSAIDDPETQLGIPDKEFDQALDEYSRAVMYPPDVDSITNYLAETASGNPVFQECLRSLIHFHFTPGAKRGLVLALSVLCSPFASYLLTGYRTPFSEQPAATRASIFQGWGRSYFPPLVGIYKQLTLVGKLLWTKSSPTFYPITGFSPVPINFKLNNGYEFNFIQLAAGEEPMVLETDVVVVGSGCGGGVSAKNLAEAGHEVLVVDKAYYYPPSQFPMSDTNGNFLLYEKGGAMMSDDGSTGIVAGSSWGGGGTVNWSACLQPQSYVRREWSEDKGLTFFGTAEFQKCLDRVSDRMGVSADHIRQNHANQTILEGSRKLGYAAKPVPQNTGGAEHYCGHCTFGCCEGNKQGPAVCWLPDAAKAGAKFMEGFRVDNVIFDESSGVKVAVGVKGVWTSRGKDGQTCGDPLVVRDVIVKAKRVVISSGTLWSPLILMNSGLKNPQIGKNLHLHPTNIIAAVWDEEIRPWEGGILTSVCTAFENIDGKGHGVKLEVTSQLPSQFLSLMNWKSAFEYKMLALKYRHMTGYISLARDRDSGYVYKELSSQLPKVRYKTTKFDAKHILEGLIAIAKMNYIQGAVEIHPFIAGMPPFIRNPPPTGPAPPYAEHTPSNAEDIDMGVYEPRFVAWIEELRAYGNSPATASYGSAHQMGSNRMSAKARDGVVDARGKVWGTENLYVADASVFPSASGVNPMITIMAIADWISRGVSKGLKASERKASEKAGLSKAQEAGYAY